MTSLRHNLGSGSDDGLLNAARDCILAVGVKRTTLTDVARRAGVSRMTLYRRWPDMQTLLADLMTRELVSTAAEVTDLVSSELSGVARVSAGASRTVAALRHHPLFRKIREVDPELLLPYLLDRRGRTQDAILAMLEATIEEARQDGSVRAEDPKVLARAVMLTAQGYLLATSTMSDGASEERLDEELRVMLDRYLAP